MATSPYPIAAQSPVIGIATLTTPTAVTSRANITGTTGLTKLTNASTNGTRIDSIIVKCKATSVATNVFLWLYDGTTSYLIDEIDVPSVTASNTVDSSFVSKAFGYGLSSSTSIPATYQLYVSVSVQQDLTVFAMGGSY